MLSADRLVYVMRFNATRAGNCIRYDLSDYLPGFFPTCDNGVALRAKKIGKDKEKPPFYSRMPLILPAPGQTTARIAPSTGF